jgi:hypothetical protein
MGTEVDLHTPHWHGSTVTLNGMRTDVANLLPASMLAAAMTAAAAIASAKASGNQRSNQPESVRPSEARAELSCAVSWGFCAVAIRRRLYPSEASPGYNRRLFPIWQILDM